jgi:N-acetylglucosaminyl-diphospho-decaprenol L-rhamnosyltransferase
MIKREVFERVGHFTEDYFMYAEDLDLCYKVHRAGFCNYYVKEASLIHYGGKSSSPLPAIRMKWKAIPRFCDKHRGRFYGLLFRAAMAATAIGRLSLVAIAAWVGKGSAKKEGLQMARAKWSIILRALLAPPAGERNSSQQKRIPARELRQL